jgi:hypothetical protein
VPEGIRHSNSVARGLLEEKGLDLERLPVSIADFIKLVIKKMRYRKKVRAEVMAELTAHFEDVLKDCRTDQEKVQKAKELVADFGDVKLLGILLRRAKKRCRPLWQTIAARTFQTIGILILFFVVYVAWFLTGKPAITVDYLAQLNQIVRPAADESLNAAPLYIKATQLYGKASDDFLILFAENYKEIGDARNKFIADQITELFSNDKKTDFKEEKLKIQEQVANRLNQLLRKKYRESSVGERKFVARWLKEKRQALDLLIAGAQKPHHWRKYANKENTTEMMSVLMPHLARFRNLARSLCWRAHLRAEQGRYEDAFSDIKSCYRLGQHIKGDNTFLIEQLVGMAIEGSATQTLRDILSEYEIDFILLTKLQKDFEQIVAGEDFIVSFETEKLSMYDIIQRCFTEDRLGGGHLCLKALAQLGYWIDSDPFELILENRAWMAPLHVLFTHPNKQETRKMVDRYYAFWNKMARKTPAQIHSEDIDFENQVLEIIEGNILLEILCPDFGRAIERSYQIRADVQALVTIISSLRYENDKGSYPENLEELITTGYLKELPIDPWSDKPLVYKKTDEGFMLYSIGENFKDDGGEVIRDDDGRVQMWECKGDAVFWPVPKPETPEEREKRLEKRGKRRTRRGRK